MKSFLRAALVLSTAGFYLTSASAATPGSPSPQNQSPAPELDFMKDLLDIDRAQKAEKKDEAYHLNQALYEKLSDQLALAQSRLADLSLIRINPFATPESRNAANAAYPSARDATKLLIMNYGAFMQGQAAFLKNVGKPEDETISGIGRSYQAMLGIKTLLTAAILMDGNLKGPDGKPLDAHRIFSGGIEAASRANPNSAAEGAARFLASAKDKMPVTAELSAKVSKNFLNFLSAYVSITEDNLTVDEMLTSLIGIDSTNPALWAERSKARIALGEIDGAYHDVIIALTLGGETPVTLAARNAFQAAPPYPASLFQEPAIALYKAQAGMVSFTGGSLTTDGARAVRAAQRNRDRRLYACAFITDSAQRATAIKWVLESNPEDTALRGEVLGDKAQKFEAAYKTATETKNSAGIFAAYDDYAPYLAWHHTFWRRRATDLFKINQRPAALAAIEVAAAISPDDKSIIEALDLIASSIRKP